MSIFFSIFFAFLLIFASNVAVCGTIDYYFLVTFLIEHPDNDKEYYIAYNNSAKRTLFLLIITVLLSAFLIWATNDAKMPWWAICAICSWLLFLIPVANSYNYWAIIKGTEKDRKSVSASFFQGFPPAPFSQIRSGAFSRLRSYMTCLLVCTSAYIFFVINFNYLNREGNDAMLISIGLTILFPIIFYFFKQPIPGILVKRR